MRARGFTLVEVVIALAITGMLAVAAVGLVQTSLQMAAGPDAKTALLREGLLAVERIAAEAGKSTCVLVPNGRRATRDVLIISGSVNQDGDFYFGDPLFPRVDEDPSKEMVIDERSGIRDVDDDGDGYVDEASYKDDDEDGLVEEDRLDGIDNDWDGSIDEDVSDDANADGAPGISGMNDDGDGTIDEGDLRDDDEDGLIDEDGYDPVMFYRHAATNTLRTYLMPSGAQTTLCTHVTAFQATWRVATFSRAPYVEISLTLTGDDGAVVTVTETVCPENVKQRIGKRVR